MNNSTASHAPSLTAVCRSLSWLALLFFSPLPGKTSNEFPLAVCNMTAPPTIFVSTSPGVCVANAVTSPLPGFTPAGCEVGNVLEYSLNNGPFVIVGTGPFSPTITFVNLPKGSNTITWKMLGNTVNQTIHVIDNIPPAANCPGNQTRTVPAGDCGYQAVGNEFYPNPTDNCPGTTVVQTSGPFAGGFFYPGVYTLSFQISDAASNQTSCSFQVTINGSVHPDINALIDLYNLTDGPNWSSKTGWQDGAAGTDCDPCDWFGVTCNGAGRVSRLDLQVNNLTGNIPPAIGDLTDLHTLDMEANNLTGSIPTQIGMLANLNRLTLNNNSLSGSIPVEIGNLTSLQVLSLHSNGLTGNIPTQIGSLTNLKTLFLNNNSLSGSIPIQVGRMTSLERLFLNSNSLSGSIPAQIGSLSNLLNLNLQHNSLSGSIPTQMGNLTNLEFLWLNNNGLSGSIPSQIGSLVLLQDMYLHDNNLSGSIPTQIGSMVSLRVFHSYNNNLSGSIPTQIGNLAVLHELYLNNNNLSGCYPAGLSIVCNDLTNFTANAGLPGGGGAAGFAAFCANGTGGDADSDGFCKGSGSGDDCNDSNNTIYPGAPELCDGLDNDCDGQIDQNAHPDFAALMALYNSTDGPNWINKTGWQDGAAGTDCDPCDWYGVTCNSSGRVTSINLNNNNLVGPLPVSIDQLTFLTSVHLYTNQISGSIPGSIGNLSNLTDIRLENNALTGTIPASLGSLGSLQYLYLSNNQLSGSIPPSLGSLANLDVFYLSHNQLSGCIPTTINGLTSCYTFAVADNQLDGTIPGQVTAMTNLGALWLGNNLLDSPIPDLSSLTNLTQLELDQNQFSGSLPGWLGNMPWLTILHLDRNQFSGPIPGVFGNLTNLTQLHLFLNQLSGCYDPGLIGLCPMSVNDLLLSGNAGLPGSGSATAWTAFCNSGSGGMPTTANAGPDQIGPTTCGITTTTLSGNSPVVGTGLWSIVSGSGGSFVNASSPTTTFSGSPNVIYTLRWTISNAPCGVSTDDVDVKFNIPVTCPPNRNVSLNSSCQIIIPDLQGEMLTGLNPICFPNPILPVTQSPAYTGIPVPKIHNQATTVTLTVADLNGNTATCPVILTAKDVTPPVFVPNPPISLACPTGPVYMIMTAACKITIPNVKVYYAASDNCGPVTISQSPASGPPAITVVHNEIIPITITATDAAGNIATCTRNVQAKDVTAPVITTCPPSQTVTMNASTCQIVVPNKTAQLVATDCSPMTVTQVPLAGTLIGTSPGQTHIVTFTVKDVALKSATCTAVLTATGICEPFQNPDDRENSASEKTATALRIFPNPAGEKLTLLLNDYLETEDLQIILFDNKGLIVRDLYFRKVKSPIEEISLEGVQNGLYFVRFIAPDRKPETVKVAVQHTF